MADEPTVPYLLTDAHRQAAARCAAPAARPSPVRGVIGWVITIAVGVALFAFLQSRPPPRAMPASPAVAPSTTITRDAIVGGGGVIVGLAMVYVPIRLARRFAKPMTAPADRFAVTDRGIAWTWPHRRIVEPWSRFAGRLEGDGVALLQYRDGPNVILPDAAMTDAMRGTLRDRLVCLGRSVT